MSRKQRFFCEFKKIKALNYQKVCEEKDPRSKSDKTICAGFEPATFCSVGRRAIHCASRPMLAKRDFFDCKKKKIAVCRIRTCEGDPNCFLGNRRNHFAKTAACHLLVCGENCVCERGNGRSGRGLRSGRGRKEHSEQGSNLRPLAY